MSNSFATSWVVAHQAPCPWDFPGKNAGLGCHFLLQSIFPTQRLNSCLLWLLHWQMDSLLPPGKHYMMGSKSQYMVAIIIFIVKFVLENELTHLRNSLIYILWNVVYSQCHVIFWCTAKWFSYTNTHTHIHTYIYILFYILFHYGLLQDIEYSYLCYTVRLYCLPILCILACIC